MNKPFKYLLYILAYLPLIFTVIIRFTFNIFTIIGFIVFAVVFILILRQLLTSSGEVVELTEIRFEKPRGFEYTAFILTYLIPFLTFIDTATLIALIVVYAVIAYIYVSTPLFSVNPLLRLIFGYDIYYYKSGEGESFLLAKDLNKLGNPLKIRMLEANLLIVEET